MKYRAWRRAAFFNVAAGDFLYFTDARGLVKANVGERNARVEEVLMRVVEARDDRAALCVEDFRISGDASGDFFVRADRGNEAVFDKERLFKAPALNIDVGVADKGSGHDESLWVCFAFVGATRLPRAALLGRAAAGTDLY